MKSNLINSLTVLAGIILIYTAPSQAKNVKQKLAQIDEIKKFSASHSILSPAFYQTAKSHRNNKLLKIYITNWFTNENLNDVIDSEIFEEVWVGRRDSVEVEIKNENFGLFQKMAKSLRIKYEIVDENVEQMILDSLPSGLGAGAGLADGWTAGAAFNYSTYNTYEDTRAWMADMAQTFDFITLETVGTTFENRIIEAIKISTSSTKGKTVNKAVIFNTGIHAREWIGPAHLIYIVKMMIDEYTGPNGQNSDIAQFLDEMDIYLIPNSNADGYAFTWSEDRMWRRTRTDWGMQDDCLRAGTGFGADPNRNYPVQWDQPNGASTSPCSDQYKGPFAASEKCVQAQIDYVENLTNKYEHVAYLDVHSYSQLWMYNYAYSTSKKAENDYVLHLISTNVVNAIEATFGTQFEYGPIATTIYEASGSSVDTTMDMLGIACNFAPELRDKGRYGFLLPDSQIPDVALEMYNGYKVMFWYVREGYCEKLF